jgi:hypothetical protein
METTRLSSRVQVILPQSVRDSHLESEWVLRFSYALPLKVILQALRNLVGPPDRVGNITDKA